MSKKIKHNRRYLRKQRREMELVREQRKKAAAFLEGSQYTKSFAKVTGQRDFSRVLNILLLAGLVLVWIYRG